MHRLLFLPPKQHLPKHFSLFSVFLAAARNTGQGGHCKSTAEEAQLGQGLLIFSILAGFVVILGGCSPSCFWLVTFSRPGCAGLGATWSGAHGKGWNETSFKAPSIPNHQIFLGFYDSLPRGVLGTNGCSQRGWIPLLSAGDPGPPTFTQLPGS